MLRTISAIVFLAWATPVVAGTGASYFDLNLRHAQYPSSSQHTGQLDSYTIFSGDLNIETQSPGFNFKVEPVFQDAVQIPGNEFYFGVPELYVQPRKIAPGFNLTIGRRRRLWSRLDEEFNLGVWQPQLRWDYLRPMQQGLTGVFFDWSLSSALRFSFFTSPVFVPDQGPNFQLRAGHFTSANRWFAPPQSRVQLFENTPYGAAPLYFKIKRPSEEDIIMHSSFGVGMNYQSSGPFWSQVSYAYKPRNQIHLGIECANCTNISSGPPEVTAVIHPRIVKHNVLTWEGGFDRVDDKGWLSLTGDVPLKSGFPAAYAESPLNTMIITGFGYQHYVRPWFGVPSWLEYSYMRTFELKRKSEAGLVPDDSVSSSLDRYPYSEVAAIDWKILFLQNQSNRLHWRNRYSYSFPERGGWWTTDLEWAHGALTYNLGGDILGAGVDPNSPEAGLFSRYRANDRVTGSVRYVF